MRHLALVDLLILLAYLAGVVGFGCWFVRKSRSTEEFMAAGRSLPGWAVGLSIFGTYVSSISFLANPGKSYGGNWNPFVFGLSLPIAAWIATRWFVPFYRKGGQISAYDHLEHRFGPWARTYAVVCYLLTQVARMGSIMYLVALALAPLLGWDIRTIILLTGILVTIYTLLGGIEAVIWTDVVQSLVLTGGMVVCIVLILIRMPGGPAEIFAIAGQHDKFSLGGFGASLTDSTFWVVLVFGLVINLQNFGIDQSYVQRYITARSDGDAVRSVWLGALLYLPISAILFFIGTALFAFYQVQPELLGTVVKADKVFPHFIVSQLPVGACGLLIAAVMAAAMSSVDSSLNSSASLILCDVYKRYFRPAAKERESMQVLYTATLVLGVIGTAVALVMIGVKSALDTWWHLSGVFSGGMLGLFLLGIMARRVTNVAAITGVIAGVLVIFWMTFSPEWGRLPGAVHMRHGQQTVQGVQIEPGATPNFDRLAPGDRLVIGDHRVTVQSVAGANKLTLTEPYAGPTTDNAAIYRDDIWYQLRSPLHSFLITVVGTLAILLVGFLASLFISGNRHGVANA